MQIRSSAGNNKQRWNEDKCRCECRVLIDKGMCDNPANTSTLNQR